MLLHCSYLTCYRAVYVTLPFPLQSVVTLPMLLQRSYLTCYCAVYVTLPFLLHSVVTSPMLLHSVAILPTLLHSICYVYAYVERYTANAHSILHSAVADFCFSLYFSLIAAEYKTNTNNGNYKNTVKPTALFTVYPDIQLVITTIIISNLSNDRSKASSKTIPPHSAI